MEPPRAPSPAAAIDRLAPKAGLLTHGLLLLACLLSACGPKPPFTKPKWHDDLVAAIRQNDVDAVARLYGANTLAPDAALNANAVTPLMVASTLGSDGVVQWLLDQGARPDAVTALEEAAEFPEESGCTALMMASAHGHLDIARLLVKRGADVNHADGRGNTPLIFASTRGQLDTVKFLVEQGADMNRRGSKNWTPLLTAIGQNQAAAAEYLVARGADANASTPDGQSPLMMASGRGYESLVNLLIEKGASVKHTSEDGKDALVNAAVAGHTNIVALLLAKGAERDLPDRAGSTALMQAAAHGQCDTVKALCDAGADPTRRNQFGRTALDYARGLLSTNEPKSLGDTRAAVKTGLIREEEAYYVLLRRTSDGDYDCVLRVLEECAARALKRGGSLP